MIRFPMVVREPPRQACKVSHLLGLVLSLETLMVMKQSKNPNSFAHDKQLNSGFTMAKTRLSQLLLHD